ncbi:MAG: hypothetical protein H7301_09610 [Cryobacterium sp.]|nr:hypothetical protein [Oligoflexia bacterium]
MKSPKNLKNSHPTPSDLRNQDPKVLHAEIAFLRQKIAEKIETSPHKAAVIVADFLQRPSAASNPKVAPSTRVKKVG